MSSRTNQTKDLKAFGRNALIGLFLAGALAGAAFAQATPTPPATPPAATPTPAPAAPGAADPSAVAAPGAATPGAAAPAPAAAPKLPPIPPRVPLVDAAGQPIKDPKGIQAAVPAIMSNGDQPDTRPVFGPDGKLMPQMVKYQGNAVQFGPDGKVVLVADDDLPRVPALKADGTPELGPNGQPLTAPVVIGPDGKPRLEGGKMIALPLAHDADGKPLLDSKGRGMAAAPLIPDTLPLFNDDGTPMLNPNGNPVLVPIERSPDGRPILTSAGKPRPQEVKKDEQGRVRFDEQGNPILASAEEEKKDLTPIGMFLTATIVVQVVMIMLLIASLVSWSILLSKLAAFASLNRKTDKFLEDFRRAGRVQDALKSVSARDRKTFPPAEMLDAAVNELEIAGKGAGSAGRREHVTERISVATGIAQANASTELGSGMGFLATTGSISPFVGLFGTVWGIMNSFIGIANTNTTNLAVVAPGIAEALMATAIGLFAAIPAVIFYNMFSRKIAAYNIRLDNFSGELLTRISRQLDRGE